LCEEEDHRAYRAQMPCGHTVTAQSLFKWCEKELKVEHRLHIRCGVCSAQWPFEEVTKMAMMTEEEESEADQIHFDNL
ncbi:hypothetical protein WMY93_033964, partial [Mugilogobius chulae]